MHYSKLIELYTWVNFTICKLCLSKSEAYITYIYTHTYVCVCVLNHFSHVRLFAILWTVAHQASLFMGWFRQELLKWVAMPSSRVSSWPRDWTCISCNSCISGGFFNAEPLGTPIHTYICYVRAYTKLFHILASTWYYYYFNHSLQPFQ